MPRAYSTKEIKRFIDLLRGSEDFSDAEIIGMDALAGMLDRFERMTDAELEAHAQNICTTLIRDENAS